MYRTDVGRMKLYMRLSWQQDNKKKKIALATGGAERSPTQKQTKTKIFDGCV